MAQRPWTWKSPRARAVSACAISVLGLVLIPPSIRRRVFARETAAPAVEPTALGQAPIEASFGFDQGVTYPHRREKEFEFELATPSSAVALLHFQSRVVGPGELTIEVNGQNLGGVSEDSRDAAQGADPILIPARVLRRGENRVAFLNARTPSEQVWWIRNLSIEILPLPELPPAQLVLEADAAFRRAEANFARRDVASPNRYLAWRDYRLAWLMLEAHPKPRPELYLWVQARMKAAQSELDRTCAKLRLEILRFASHQQWSELRATMEQVGSYFPNDDQPCPKLAERTLSSLPL